MGNAETLFELFYTKNKVDTSLTKGMNIATLFRGFLILIIAFELYECRPWPLGMVGGKGEKCTPGQEIVGNEEERLTNECWRWVCDEKTGKKYGVYLCTSSPINIDGMLLGDVM